MLNPEIKNFMASLLPPHPQKAGKFRYQGRRKFRGQKRYYRQIQRKALSFLPDLSVGHWYDYWHYHADWPGYGNLGWKHRKAHIAALCTVYMTFARCTKDYYQPFQLWVYLDREDAGQDAVYFHTPNPNGEGNHFPAKFTDVNWGLPALEEFFTDHLEMPLRAGVENRACGTIYYVYSPVYGESIE